MLPAALARARRRRPRRRAAAAALPDLAPPAREPLRGRAAAPDRRRRGRAAGRPARAVARAPARRARRRPLRRRAPGRGRLRAGGPDADRRGRGLRRAGAPPRSRARGRRCPRRPRATCSRSTRRAPSSPAATTAAPSTASRPSSSSSTAGASRASPCARRSCATGRSCPCAGCTSTCRAATSSASPAATMRDLLLRFKFNGIVLEVGGGMRLESHPEISAGWRRTVAEWYAHGETMDKLGEGIPLGTARRFAASLHVGVGGGAYVEKDDVRRLAEWAELYGLEIVPEVQALSHTYYIASARRDVAEDPEMAWPDSYCPSNPESYRIFFDVLDEYIDVLRPKRVHIGHDEWRAGAFCPRCRGKDTGALYADDVLKIHRHLKREGDRDLDVGRPLRGRPQPLREAVVGGRRRPLREAGHRLGAGPHRGRDERDPHPQLVGPGGRRHVPEAGLALHRRQLRRQRGEGLAGPRRPQRRPRGEVSSWGAFAEFILGKLQIPEAVFSSNLLWSIHDPKKEDALEHVGQLLPDGARACSRPKPLPSFARRPHALRGPRHRLRVQQPAEGRRLGPLGPEARAGTTSRGCPTRSPTPRCGRPLGGGRRATPGRRAHPRGAPDPRPLGLARLRPVGHRRGPARRSTRATRRTSRASPRSSWASTRSATRTISSRPTRSATTRRSAAGTPASRCPSTSRVRSSPGRCPTGGRGRLGERVGEPPPGRRRSPPSPSWDRPGPSNARPILLGVTAVEKPRVEDLR